MARMSSQLENKVLKSFARGDMAMALADTGHTGRKQIMDMSVWNSVKDAKAPACCALAVPDLLRRCLSVARQCSALFARILVMFRRKHTSQATTLWHMRVQLHHHSKWHFLQGPNTRWCDSPCELLRRCAHCATHAYDTPSHAMHRDDPRCVLTRDLCMFSHRFVR